MRKTSVVRKSENVTCHKLTLSDIVRSSVELGCRVRSCPNQHSGVEQWSACLVHTQDVVGSNPTFATKKVKLKKLAIDLFYN